MRSPEGPREEWAEVMNKLREMAIIQQQEYPGKHPDEILPRFDRGCRIELALRGGAARLMSFQGNVIAIIYDSGIQIPDGAIQLGESVSNIKQVLAFNFPWLMDLLESSA